MKTFILEFSRYWDLLVFFSSRFYAFLQVSPSFPFRHELNASLSPSPSLRPLDISSESPRRMRARTRPFFYRLPPFLLAILMDGYPGGRPFPPVVRSRKPSSFSFPQFGILGSLWLVRPMPIQRKLEDRSPTPPLIFPREPPSPATAADG